MGFETTALLVMDVQQGHVAGRHLDHVDEAVAATGPVSVGEDAAAGAEEEQLSA